MNKIAIFASGSGSNAENIINFFKDSDSVEIVLVLSNNPHAGVLDRAKILGVETIVFNKEEFVEHGIVLRILEKNKIDWLVLAGFLWLVPLSLIQAFPQRIINIHPSLLPKYGGKGMYGMKVHEAVVAAQEHCTGITIHYVNEFFDEGEIIFQTHCEVLPGHSPEEVACHVHELEYVHYPQVIAQCLEQNTP